MTKINADWRWARCLVFQHSIAEELGKWFWSIYRGLGHGWEGEYMWLSSVTSYAVLAYAEVISPEFFNTIRARLFILYGTCMELVEEDLIVPRGCWVQNIFFFFGEKLGPKYQTPSWFLQQMGALCKGAVRDVEFIGYYCRDAIRRDVQLELQNPNDT